jgi:hypothetical protein
VMSESGMTRVRLSNTSSSPRKNNGDVLVRLSPLLVIHNAMNAPMVYWMLSARPFSFTTGAVTGFAGGFCADADTAISDTIASNSFFIT